MTHVPLVFRVAQDDRHVEQDALDGEAMRLLREVAAQRGWHRITAQWGDDEGGRPAVVMVVCESTTDATLGRIGSGRTLSAAADACREALIS